MFSDHLYNIPFKNDFTYDAFGNQTQNINAHFTRTETINTGYTNNRITSWGQYSVASVYDADGNLTDNEPSSPNKDYRYDASGRMSGTHLEYTDTSVMIHYTNIETLT